MNVTDEKIKKIERDEHFLSEYLSILIISEPKFSEIISTFSIKYSFENIFQS